MSGAVRLSLAQRSRLRCCNVAGSDAVALDIVLAVLGSDILREHLETALCSRISGDRLAAEFTHHRADVDDLAFLLLHHVRKDCLGDDESGIQVDVNDLAELIHRHLMHRDPLDDSRIVHKDIDRSEVLLNVSDHLRDFVFLGHIADISAGIDALLCILFKRCVEMMLSAAVERDLGTCICESFCNCKSDSVSCSCNERNAAFK